MALTLEKFQSSDLNRNSARVFGAAEQAPIRVTRRDGENLVLMSEQEFNAKQRLLELAAQIIAVTTDDNGTLEQRMSNMFPWMLALNEEEKVQCSHDLVEAARASFATGQIHLAATELVSWKETAVNVASGFGRLPVEWLDEAIQVERPD